MAGTTRRLAFALLATEILMGFAAQANAAPLQITFSGQSSSGTCVTGNFLYEQTHRPTTPPPHSGVFDFTGPAGSDHGICSTLVTVPPSPEECFSGGTCLPFTIKTMTDPTGKRTFTLLAKYRNANNDSVQIDISLTTLKDLNGNTLPDCTAFVNFSGAAKGTYKKTVNGVVVGTCNIAATNCGPPAPQAPPKNCPPAPGTDTVRSYSPPAACPVYSCPPPRRKCFLTRVFSRRSILACRR